MDALFSALGASSGFDAISECFADLTGEIFAVETGLSSDPAMNWRLSQLDRYPLVSNSDAHSPEKLGREVSLFAGDLSYFALRDALRSERERFLGTVDVGMTRARSRLVLTWAQHRTLFGASQLRAPSPFLQGLPPQLLRVSTRAGPRRRPQQLSLL